MAITTWPVNQLEVLTKVLPKEPIPRKSSSRRKRDPANSSNSGQTTDQVSKVVIKENLRMIQEGQIMAQLTLP
jgi:hypothetical protein